MVKMVRIIKTIWKKQDGLNDQNVQDDNVGQNMQEGRAIMGNCYDQDGQDHQESR